MCRTAHAVLSSVICGIQMLVRVFMTAILMIENVFRMCLQTMYNFISFMLQLISLIPICCVFLISSRMKCFMCGGGGPCPVSRGGACDCLMSLFAIIILFVIFRATGVLDKIFFNMGYAKATTRIIRFVPTTGTITECSRNDTDTEYVFYPLETTQTVVRYFYVEDDTTTPTMDFRAFTEFSTIPTLTTNLPTPTTTALTDDLTISTPPDTATTLPKAADGRMGGDDIYGDITNPTDVNDLGWTDINLPKRRIGGSDKDSNKSSTIDLGWTTVLYYLA